MSQHTPGPWRVGDAGATVFGPKSDKPAPEIVATVKHKANARLIAAAPELYKTVLDEHPHRSRVPSCSTCALLAKVGGTNER